MIPYGNSLFFYILFLAMIPAMILGILEKPIKHYGFAISIAMLGLFIGKDKIQLVCFSLFYVGEVTLLKCYDKLNKKFHNVWIMRLAVFFAVLPLILVKFSQAFTTRTIGFIGISYITFKAVQVIIEIYDGLIKDVSIYDYTYFIIFFPTLSSGPVDKSRRFKNDVNNVIERTKYINDYLGEGIYKIFKGVLYKFVIANLISHYWMNVIPKEHNFINGLSYMYAYSFYLFFDFAGYSLMAIGAGYILGVKVPENFNKPFISKDMKEFWNRWHMTVSFWFRDYVYTRFVMASMRKNRFKSRYAASYIGFFINMLLMGIWHGNHLFYVIYGAYEAMLLVLTDFYQRKSKFHKKYKKKLWYKSVSVCITFNLICFGLLLFSGYIYNK